MPDQEEFFTDVADTSWVMGTFHGGKPVGTSAGAVSVSDRTSRSSSCCGKESMDLCVASLLLVAMPGAPSSFLFLVVRPGGASSVLAPSSKVILVDTRGSKPQAWEATLAKCVCVCEARRKTAGNGGSTRSRASWRRVEVVGGMIWSMKSANKGRVCLGFLWRMRLETLPRKKISRQEPPNSVFEV